MRSWLMISLFILSFSLLPSPEANAQCSICTKTAQQMGEKPGKALNGAIIYLAAAPLLIMGYIGYRWYQHNRGE